MLLGKGLLIIRGTGDVRWPHAQAVQGLEESLPHVGSAPRSILPCPSNHPLVSRCFNFSWSAGVKNIFLFVSSMLQVSGSEEHC